MRPWRLHTCAYWYTQKQIHAVGPCHRFNSARHKVLKKYQNISLLPYFWPSTQDVKWSGQIFWPCNVIDATLFDVTELIYVSKERGSVDERAFKLRLGLLPKGLFKIHQPWGGLLQEIFWSFGTRSVSESCHTVCHRCSSYLWFYEPTSELLQKQRVWSNALDQSLWRWTRMQLVRNKNSLCQRVGRLWQS